jgi:UDP-glucuronate decarboxylase
MHIQQRILVTGGAGFLGSHLCERLLAEGGDVLCADNFFTGTRKNIEHLLDHKHFELMRHDVTFALYVEVDEIYNLACPASPVHSARSGANDQDQRPWRDQHAWACKARKGENSPGIHF